MKTMPKQFRLILNQLAIAHFDKESQQEKSFLISLRHLKSINWLYNKKLAKFQAILAKIKEQHEQTKDENLKINIQQIKNKIGKLTTKRNRKMEVALHKISKKLVDKLSSFSINTLIIGKNKEWKKEINLGDCNKKLSKTLSKCRWLNY